MPNITGGKKFKTQKKRPNNTQATTLPLASDIENGKYGKIIQNMGTRFKVDIDDQECFADLRGKMWGRGKVKKGDIVLIEQAKDINKNIIIFKYNEAQVSQLRSGGYINFDNREGNGDIIFNDDLSDEEQEELDKEINSIIKEQEKKMNQLDINNLIFNDNNKKNNDDDNESNVNNNDNNKSNENQNNDNYNEINDDDSDNDNNEILSINVNRINNDKENEKNIKTLEKKLNDKFKNKGRSSKIVNEQLRNQSRNKKLDNWIDNI